MIRKEAAICTNRTNSQATIPQTDSKKHHPLLHHLHLQLQILMSNKHKQLFTEGAGPSSKKQRSAPYKVVECWDWKEGNCPRGEKCTFAHRSLSPTPTNQPHPVPQSSRSSPKPSPPCKYFQAGNCLRGDACPFPHILPTQIPCKYFVARGFCSNQERCKFAHVQVEESEKRKILEEFNAYQKYARSSEEISQPIAQKAANENAKIVNLPVFTGKREVLSRPMLQIFQIPPFFPASLEQSAVEKAWIQEAIARFKPFTSPF